MQVKKADIGQIIRFAIVGIGATLTHMLAALALLHFLKVSPLTGNFIGFLVAFVVSFTGHYFWTFSRPGKHRRALLRFFVTALAGFLINTMVLVALLADGRISETLSLAFAIAVIPAVTFLIGRFWAFRAVS
jgi:putative flippase GtrA